MKRISPYLDAAATAISVVFGFAGQIGDNLVYLASNDLSDQHIEHDLERNTQLMANDIVNSLIADLQTEEAQIVPLVEALIADDATQKSRVDALQAQIDTLTATGGDQATITALQGLKDGLTPLLTALTPTTPTPVVIPEPVIIPDPVVTTEPVEEPTTPLTMPDMPGMTNDPAATDPAATDPATTDPAAAAPDGSDAAAQADPSNPTAPVIS